jgi:hypothetical protein
VLTGNQPKTLRRVQRKPTGGKTMNIFEITFSANVDNKVQQLTLRRVSASADELKSSLQFDHEVRSFISCEPVGKGFKDGCFWHDNGQADQHHRCGFFQ